MTTSSVIVQWIKIGAFGGILANILYPVLLTVALPGPLEIFLAGLFGILISVSGFAVHYTLSRVQASAWTQLAALFVFAGGVILNLMLVVQLNFVGVLSHYQGQTKEKTALEILNWIGRTVDPIHLAMDVSWDFFLSLATIIFAIAMYRNALFGKLWSLTGGLAGAILLGVKCYYFPFTPYDMGLPYVFGPLVSLWYLAVCIQCLTKLPKNKVRETVVDSNF